MSAKYGRNAPNSPRKSERVSSANFRLRSESARGFRLPKSKAKDASNRLRDAGRPVRMRKILSLLKNEAATRNPKQGGWNS